MRLTASDATTRVMNQLALTSFTLIVLYAWLTKKINTYALLIDTAMGQEYNESSNVSMFN
jgi:hypothetical protein